MKRPPSGDTTLSVPDAPPRRRAAVLPRRYALCVVWFPAEPERVGEALELSIGQTATFGRGEAGKGGEPRVLFTRRSRTDLARPLESRWVSREQLRLHAREGGVEVERTGRCAIRIDGTPAERGTLAPGQTLELEGQVLLLCVARRAPAPPPVDAPLAPALFGGPDACGLVGESEAAWELRERVAFAAPRAAHVLVLGASGTGKELVARGLHALSPRRAGRFVARNAATLPAGLVDAELFGNVKSYPNPGMPERPGLFGEAAGGTLFLDEIAELPLELQTHLLRVLDAGGEYHRLGEAAPRRADVRLVAATNRGAQALKHDLAARFALRIEVPGLDARPEDVPLLARHLLGGIAGHDPEIAERFFTPASAGARPEPRLSLELVRALCGHAWTTHVRELEAILWRSLDSSDGEVLERTDAVAEALGGAPSEPAPAAGPAVRRDVTPEEIRAALLRAGGVQEKARLDLGLPNRWVLRRLMKKHGIEG